MRNNLQLERLREQEIESIRQSIDTYLDDCVTEWEDTTHDTEGEMEDDRTDLSIHMWNFVCEKKHEILDIILSMEAHNYHLLYHAGPDSYEDTLDMLDRKEVDIDDETN